MLLLFMIVFSVVGFAIAVIPVLAVTVHEHRAQARTTAGSGRPAADRRGPTVVVARGTDDRQLVAGIS
jgi:hypothetical protein